MRFPKNYSRSDSFFITIEKCWKRKLKKKKEFLYLYIEKLLRSRVKIDGISFETIVLKPPNTFQLKCIH